MHLALISKKGEIGNNNVFIRKSLRKEIIIGSKSRTSVNWQNYKKQRNQCVKALKMQKYSNFKTIL